MIWKKGFPVPGVAPPNDENYLFPLTLPLSPILGERVG